MLFIDVLAIDRLPQLRTGRGDPVEAFPLWPVPGVIVAAVGVAVSDCSSWELPFLGLHALSGGAGGAARPSI